MKVTISSSSDSGSEAETEEEKLVVSKEARIRALRLLKAVIDMRMPTEKRIGGLCKKRTLLATYDAHISKQLTCLESEMQMSE